MNEIKKCSISGIAFQFEPDAYEELSRYLEELHKQYQEDPDGKEIIADIEARVAELILSTQENSRIIALPLVRNIIAQLGSAAEIEQESSTDEQHSNPQEQPRQQEPRIPRRLYRSAEGAKLGGVCSGLGNYFDIDPVWVRLAFILPLILSLFVTNHWGPFWLQTTLKNLSGFVLLGYLIMWFAVPTARSARQKLEMKGEKITPETIRQKTAEARNDVDGRPKAVVADTVSTLGMVLTILLKIFAGIILMGLVLGACALIVGLLAVVISPELISPMEVDVWIALCGILAVLIPCLLLIYVLFSLIASMRPNGKLVGFTFLGWVVIVFLLISLAIKEVAGNDSLKHLLPTPTHSSQNLMNHSQEVSESVEEALERTKEALEQAGEALNQSGEALNQTGLVKVTTPEGTIEMKVDESGLRIDVKEPVQ